MYWLVKRKLFWFDFTYKEYVTLKNLSNDSKWTHAGTQQIFIHTSYVLASVLHTGNTVVENLKRKTKNPTILKSQEPQTQRPRVDSRKLCWGISKALVNIHNYFLKNTF